MNKYDFFWKTMELCDWDNEGDDELVLKPVIEYLSSLDDDEIFRFDDLMTELLFALDTRELAKQCEAADEYMSDDSFLYSRCVALINGPAFYEKALAGEVPEMWGMEFESLLYVSSTAWCEKHGKDDLEYPHLTPVSYETGSNTEGWK